MDRQFKVEIVKFDETWAADFARLNYEWIARYFEIERHDREILDHPQKAVIEPGGEIFMAVVDGQAVGTVAMIPAADGVLELTKMAVAPEFRGNGIADQLMRSSIGLARSLGAHTVFLESHRSLTPAISLYEKFGFVETEIDANSEYARADIRMELAIDSV
jgi:ribosomal protein S18 acetylase RimI-like enzyme